jgi:DNA-binding NarL/FixJ family response regulator
MSVYHLLRDHIELGPYTLEELQIGGIRSTDLVWINGRSKSWCYPHEIDELQSIPEIKKAKVETTLEKIRARTNAEVKKIELQGSQGEPEDFRPVADLEPKKMVKEPQQSQSSITIKVIIADDHALYREGIKMALSQKNDIQVVGEAENGMQLLHLLKHNMPDVILLDITMPVLDGISALTSIRNRYGDLKVIMLSMHNDRSMVSTLMETGANGYLTKTADSETIYEAIRTCYAKGNYFNDLTNLSMLDRIRAANRIKGKPAAQIVEDFGILIKLPSDETAPRNRSPRKVQKRALIATSSILLITSGIMAAITILKDPSSNNKALHRTSELPRIEPLIVKTPKEPTIQTGQVGETRKTTPVAERAINEKTIENPPAPITATQGDATESVIFRNEPFRIHVSPDMANIDISAPNGLTTDKFEHHPDLIPTNPASVPTVGILEYKDRVKTKLLSLIAVSVNEYSKEGKGRLPLIELTLHNHTIYKIDQVSLEVEYCLPDSSSYNTEILTFQNIEPLAFQVLEIPERSRGVKIKSHITSITSKDLEL